MMHKMPPAGTLCLAGAPHKAMRVYLLSLRASTLHRLLVSPRIPMMRFGALMRTISRLTAQLPTRARCGCPCGTSQGAPAESETRKTDGRLSSRHHHAGTYSAPWHDLLSATVNLDRLEKAGHWLWRQCSHPQRLDVRSHATFPGPACPSDRSTQVAVVQVVVSWTCGHRWRMLLQRTSTSIATGRAAFLQVRNLLLLRTFH